MKVNFNGEADTGIYFDSKGEAHYVVAGKEEERVSKPLKELLEQVIVERYVNPQLAAQMARRLRALDEALEKYTYKCGKSDVIYSAEVRRILDGERP